MDSAARRYTTRAPERTTLRQELAKAAMAPLPGVPLRFGAWEFVTWRSASGPGATTTLKVRRVGEPGQGRSLVESRPGYAVTLLGISPDGEKVVIGESAVGSNWIRARIVRSPSARVLDTLNAYLYRTQSSLVWSADGSGFHYVRTERASDTAQSPGPATVMYHRIGAKNDAALRMDLATSDGVLSLAGGGLSARTLVILHTEHRSGQTTVYVADARGQLGTVRPIRRSASRYAYAGEIDGSVLMVEWGEAAAAGRVASIDTPLEAPRYREIIADNGTPISNWPGTSAVVVDTQLLIGYTDPRGGLAPRLVALSGALAREITMPARGSVWSGFSVMPGTPFVRYQLTGLADPGSTYQLNVRTGVSERIDGPDVGYDPSEFLTERVEVVAQDGVRLPVDVVRHRSTAPSSRTPLILYGYGFGGWNAAPWFQPMMAAWVRGGGRWAVAGLRGDGVGGDAWHQAGVREKKAVGIADYLRVAEGLIAIGLTQSDRLVANASSAGGPLVAAAVQQRPDLFSAALFDYALFDMLRYERFGHGKQWTSEYGEISDSTQFAALYSYSPVHRVPQDRCLPPIMLTPGEMDQTATPIHSYKFAAALLERPARCRAPVLLRVTWNGGHNAGRTAHDAISTWLDELSFLRRVIPAWPLPASARSIRR
jgi:prolyl oligopeptidase